MKSERFSARRPRPTCSDVAPVQLEGNHLRLGVSQMGGSPTGTDLSGNGALQTRRIPLYSGALHYWRIDPSLWKQALTSLKQLGLPMVETYVPWGVHEVTEGHVDFGERDPRLDLGRFVDMAAELGLWVFARPGPHINAELTYFGLPKHVIYNRAYQARSPKGNPVIQPYPPQMFPIPSYASRAFAAATQSWYRAVADVLRARMYPEGPVVLLQVDNEASYYFRTGEYDQDYHKDALADYRQFLRKRYRSLDRYNQEYHTSHQTWREVTPPLSFDVQAFDVQAFDGQALGPRRKGVEPMGAGPSAGPIGGQASAPGSHLELRRAMEWAEFREVLITDSVDRFRGSLEAVGLGGVPTVHNIPLGETGQPVNLSALQDAVPLVGLDYYHRARDFETVRWRTLFLTGSTPIPYAPEMGVGAPSWFPPLDHQDSLFSFLTACAHGLRGFNLYMAVDRDRWYGAPVDDRGQPRAEARSWKSVIHALDRVDHASLHRKVEVAIQVPHEYRRLTRLTHLLGGIVTPSVFEALGGSPALACREDTLDLGRAVQLEWHAWVVEVVQALEAEQIPYVLVDSDARMERYEGIRLLFSPTFQYANRRRWKGLEQLAGTGMHLATGPEVPQMNDRFQPEVFPVGSSVEGTSWVCQVDGIAVGELVRSQLDTLGLRPEVWVQPSSEDHSGEEPGREEPIRSKDSEEGVQETGPVWQRGLSPAGDVRATLHGDASGPRALYVMNTVEDARRCTVHIPRCTRVTDLLLGDHFEDVRALPLQVPGHTCRVFALEAAVHDSPAKENRDKVERTDGDPAMGAHGVQHSSTRLPNIQRPSIQRPSARRSSRRPS